MKCETCREQLWAYLEQELTVEETQEMDQHFAECADCRREVEEEKAILDALRSLPEEELPEGYHKELMQKLNEAALPRVIPFAEKKKQPKWRQMSLAAAAVLLVVAAGGMSGILEMRQNSFDAAAQMETAVAEDAAMPAETAEVAGAAYSVEDAEMQEWKEAPEQEQFSIAETDSAENASVLMEDMAKTAGDGAVTMEESAVEAETAAVPEPTAVMEEVPAPFSMARTTMTAEATEIVSLEVNDVEAARETILENITAFGGYEEMSVDASVILARIPIEAVEVFKDSLSENGEFRQLESREPQEGDLYCVIEIRLFEK